MKILGKNEKLIIAISSIFALSNVLASMFLNVYLFTYTKSMVVMAIYTSIRIALYPPTEIFASWVATKKGYGVSMAIGLILIISSLVTSLIIGNCFEDYPNLVYIIAILSGLGEGAYYLSINTLIQVCTNSKTRANFIGINGAMVNIGNLIGPFISTFIISSSVDDIAGYKTIFKIILIFYVIILIFCSFVKVEKETRKINIIPMLNIFSDSKWKYFCIIQFLWGVRDVFPLALSGLMVYSATGGDGTVYSKLLSAFSVIAVISCYISKRYLNSSKWMKMYNIGAIITTVSLFALVVFDNLFGAILYGICNALSVAMFSNPYSFDTMNIINCYHDNVMSRLIVKEIYLTIGRVTSMLFIAILSIVIPNYYLNIGTIIGGLTPLLMIIIVNKHYCNLNKRNGEYG